MMQKTRYSPLPWTLLLSIPIAVLGCSPPPGDERLVELGQQSCDRQAEQNQTIAEQTRQLTEMSDDFLAAEGQARAETIALQREIAQAEAAAREELLQIQQNLVERDTQCRQDLNALQKETQCAIRVERQSVDRQREDLEAERRQIAAERHGGTDYRGCDHAGGAVAGVSGTASVVRVPSVRAAACRR